MNQLIEEGQQQTDQPQPFYRSKPFRITVFAVMITVFLALFLALILSNSSLNISDYKYPQQVKGKKTVAIIGTNDIHGYALGFPMRNSKTKQQYTQGGLQYMGSMIRGLFNQWKGNILWLDGGDQFQGGIESGPLVSNGSIMNDFFDVFNLSYSSIGNHQFDFGPDFLFPYMNVSKHGFLAANIFDEKGKRQFLPKTKISSLVTMQNGIVLGVIGLSTVQTPFTTTWFNNQSYPKYTFSPYPQIVKREAQNLRNNNASAVILVAHVGSQCANPPVKSQMWNNQTIQKQCKQKQIFQLVKSLQPGTVDAVVAGHVHQQLHNYVDDIPIVQNQIGGRNFNIIYLQFDQSGKKINSSIEGPIPVCSKVFSQIRRCPYFNASESDNYGKLTQYSFHGNPVQADPVIQKQFQKYQDKFKVYREQVCQSTIPLIIDRSQQNDIGNFVSDCLKNEYETDFAILNPGGFRSPLYPGIITYADVYSVFPFQNKIVTFQLTGKQLKKMIDMAQAGDKGFYQTSGLKQIINKASKTVMELKLFNGQEIQDQKTYLGASIDFLIISKGDDFRNIIPAVFTPKNNKIMDQYRNTITKCFKAKKTINASLIDPNNPRLKLE